MKITFLKASMPLTKSYSRKTGQPIQKTNYPHAFEFSSVEEDATDLKHMAHLLAKHSLLGNCICKGTPTRTLVCESRAGTTDSNASTEWIVLDVDGLPNIATIDDFLKALNLEDVSHIVQWSASYKVENNDLRAHVFMQLDKPMSAPLIKQWLIQTNHQISMLRDAMTLTKTGNSVSWPLDVTACQNDKLIYIAQPKFVGTVKDPFIGPRILYVPRKLATLDLSASRINSTEQNRALTSKRINDIRGTLGYPARKTTYKMHGGTEVLTKPDVCIITEMKTDHGFVRFNLNGGDSWAYYHPENNPDYILNFKGEPAYVTKELLPEYWDSLTSKASHISSTNIEHLMFCEATTSSYWRGTYDHNTDVLSINIAKSEKQVRDYSKQEGKPLGDFIPEWTMSFDPSSAVRVDSTTRTINTFQPTIYMKAKPRKTPTCPKLIHRIIHHALGSDPEITDRFINWLAFIIQNRDRAKTAWVLHGTTSTGKGVLMNDILRPLLGQKQTAVCRPENLNEIYNDYLEQCFMVFVDEIEVKALTNERSVMSKLKNFITEPLITVRPMYSAAHEVRNYSNWIFASNKTDPVMIDAEDRRFNVGKYQPAKLVVTKSEVENQIPRELQGFHDYLAQYAVDTLAAGTPMDTESRRNIMAISETGVDTVATAILRGDFGFFIDQLPSANTDNTNALQMNKDANYADVLRALVARTKSDGSCNISRGETLILFSYLIELKSDKELAFASMIKHHHIHFKKVRIDTKTPIGMTVVWVDTKEFLKYAAVLSPLKMVPAKPNLRLLTK